MFYPESLYLPEHISLDVAVPEIRKRIVGVRPSTYGKGVGLGYGYEYTADLAAKLLELPLGIETRFLSQPGIDFYYREARNEIFHGDFGSRHSRSKFWYPQGRERVCGAMASATAGLALGSPLEANIFAEVLNLSNRNGGINRDQLDSILRRSQSIRSVKTNMYNDSTAEFALTTKKTIDQGGIVLNLVSLGSYSPAGFGLHWILIAGYDQCGQSGVDLQVFDSEVGMMFLPVKFIHNALLGQGLALYPKSLTGLS